MATEYVDMDGGLVYDEPGDDDRCDACGEDAVASTPVPMGGGHTEYWLICQMCGHVQEED